MGFSYVLPHGLILDTSIEEELTDHPLIHYNALERGNWLLLIVDVLGRVLHKVQTIQHQGRASDVVFVLEV
jgi:hypothetical protein